MLKQWILTHLYFSVLTGNKTKNPSNSEIITDLVAIKAADNLLYYLTRKQSQFL